MRKGRRPTGLGNAVERHYTCFIVTMECPSGVGEEKGQQFVCDFRGVNNVTKRDTYPLPHIKDVIDKMAGARYWTTLDAALDYWSIPPSESDKERTAFSVPRGKYEFNATPFQTYGLSNAGSSYQRMMDMCLTGLSTQRILAYMDDIVVFNATFQEHIKDLTTVFDRLRCANVSLKKSKCVFASESVNLWDTSFHVTVLNHNIVLWTLLPNFHHQTQEKN